MSLVRRSWATRCLALAIVAALYAPAGAAAQGPTSQIVFQSDRDRNDSDLWLVDATGGNERALTRNRTPDATPSWSPDGTTIVYACAPAANWELCRIDLATRQVTQLTQTAADEFEPRYTQDGTRIVLESYPDGRNADIAIMPAAGGVPAPLTSTPGDDDQDPTPDPNSTRIAFASDGNISVLDTNAPGDVRPVTRGSRGDTDPYFSTQDEIAFARRTGRTRDVLVASPEGTLKRRLTRGGPDDLEPAWTADATQIFFARALGPSRRFRIFSMDANGRGQQAVTRGGAYDDTEPAPQPQGAGGLRAWAPRIDALAAASCHTINGTGGPNTLIGTDVRDCIYGNAGNDTLKGKARNDKLWGGSGRDRLYGGPGNDRLYATDGEKDHVNGGSGDDEAWIDDGLDSHVYTTVH